MSKEEFYTLHSPSYQSVKYKSEKYCVVGVSRSEGLLQIQKIHTLPKPLPFAMWVRYENVELLNQNQ